MVNNLKSTPKFKATNEQIKEMLDYYKGYLTYNTSEYMLSRAKLPDATITFYKTNVVLFQGNNAQIEYNRWAESFGLAVDNNFIQPVVDYSHLVAIGTDEVGTGDYFGPMVVCGTYTSTENITKLHQLGVKDSKLLTDNQIINLSLEIAQLVPYSIIFLDPIKINQLSKKDDNFNFLKAYLHNKVINSILKKITDVKYDAILIDEFTPKEKYLKYLENQPDVVENIITIPHGEKAHIAIAAASILARAAFLREMRKLSTFYKMDLPKGAGKEVDRSAISFVRSFGWNELAKVAKLKFANTTRLKAFFHDNPLPISKHQNENIK